MATERIGENVYRLHGHIPMEPWYEDRYVLARLWYWLKMRELTPADPGYFIGHAEEYAEEYQQMLMWTGQA